MDSIVTALETLNSTFGEILNQMKRNNQLLGVLTEVLAELRPKDSTRTCVVKLPCETFSSGDSDNICSHVTAENSETPPAKRLKTEFTTQDDYVTVYADGSCENNGKGNAKAGIGVWFGDNHPKNVSKPVVGRATNNVAEIQACIAAVQVAKDNGIKKLRIFTDSQFCINSMTKWIAGWKKKGWKLADGKADVKNRVDFEKLDNLRSGIQIDWVHVSGHRGVHGNEMADQLAKEGAKGYKPN